ncbi:Uncharacterized conserved protein YgiB, involved in bioifilm formation, UPF0441/DUF1190 family [Loktanella fryxellensis]|uniref:Uncharacterized conserved protein YgiB, involved in bioifilm formation, UPF0441/DUF1190 family n=1 Tax=Loktanella fryxellensis TaxID=245187 RepID=A0A1H8ART6_9RHOB|nr:DUF1190 domain-containing protein [Loktanella fryxellensis]SEM73432.1 Uncharacterized conserved protein YgiB, involved in bioifilm formation, UPF0441/DUF1190 family [Loktanella fryxellensis]
MTASVTTPIRRTKRSRVMPAVLLGAAAFALSACQDEEVEASAFPDLQACQQAAASGTVLFSAADCDATFQEALVEYERSAPRYDDQALCEEQHGGGCVAQEGTGGGGGSIFMPLMAGYLIGNMLNGNRAATQPLYRDNTGRYATAGGSTVLNGNRGTTRLSPDSFRAAPAAAAPMTRASVNATGGFGSSRTSAAPAGRTSLGG